MTPVSLAETPPVEKGWVAEAAFRLTDGRLLLLGGDDMPFDEVLSIFLVSPEGQRLATRRLMGPYTAGWLQDVAVEGERALGFNFPGPSTRWHLRVAPATWPGWLPGAALLRLRREALAGQPR